VTGASKAFRRSRSSFGSLNRRAARRRSPLGSFSVNAASSGVLRSRSGSHALRTRPRVVRRARPLLTPLLPGPPAAIRHLEAGETQASSEGHHLVVEDATSRRADPVGSASMAVPGQAGMAERHGASDRPMHDGLQQPGGIRSGPGTGRHCMTIPPHPGAEG
jgi:hypothetical protein